MPFPLNLRVELSPRRIEEELKAYLVRWFDRACRTRTYELDPLAREALEHVVSRAFLSGKIMAAREMSSPWQIVGDDSLVIQDISDQFKTDFQKIMQDLRLDLIMDGPPVQRSVIRMRFDALAQVLTWKAYNLGKASEFRRSVKQQAAVYAGAQYKYPGFFMLQTMADDGVCDDCAPLAGLMYEDYDELITELDGGPPMHVNCRCEVVGRPTVPTVEKQDRFRETWQEEQAPIQEAT
jgi:hypothetical protein